MLRAATSTLEHPLILRAGSVGQGPKSTLSSLWGKGGPIPRTSPLGKQMAKNTNLGWSWKPDQVAKQAEQTAKWIRRGIKKKRRQGKKLSRRQKLLYAPGERFYRSKTWRSLRFQVLAKYGRKCMKCDAVDVEMHVDHIMPRSKAPELSLTFENLQVLCRECNMTKSNAHADDYREESISRDIELEIAREAAQWI